MKSGSKSFLQRWLISTVAVLVATYIIPGIHYAGWLDLLVATLLLGILNTFLRPILMVLSLPFLILTLGLFTLVINAVLLLLVSWMLGPKFQVDGFWWAFLGALVISIISLLLNSITGSGNSRMQVKRGPAPPPNRRDDGGGGPVIDV
ncbi:MAG: phage holin family protein [Verrucomicrobia bacterium]|nr:phage holin family protein [Verrucomicrobiota bacterium]